MGLASTFAAGNASATTFNFTSGFATITATAGANTVMSPTVVPLTGVFVEFDDTGAGSLVDFLITLGPTGILFLDTPYGGYDEVVVESASIAPGLGYANIFNSDDGGGLYSFLASPLDINGVYSAMDSTLTNPSVMNLPVPFTDSSAINGIANIPLGTLELSSVTLTHLSGGLFGETDDLIVKADFSFTGVVPEPGTGLMVGLGLTIFSITTRKR